MTFSFDQRQIGPAFGYGLAAVIIFARLVYFTVRLWKMMMNAITQRWAKNVQQTPHVPDEQHYVNLNDLLNSDN